MKADGLRKRNPATEKTDTVDEQRNPTKLTESEDENFSMLIDAVRVILLSILVSTTLSYFITRESFIWGFTRPTFTYPAFIKAYWVRRNLLTSILVGINTNAAKTL